MAVDINPEWVCKKDNVLLYNEKCMEQNIKNALFFNRDDIYWGGRREIGLSRYLFELMGRDNNFVSMRDLGDAIHRFDRRLSLRENESTIREHGDQWQLHLVIDYGMNRTVTINEIVERV